MRREINRINKSQNRCLNKSLLENEYDLLGYTSLRMHDDEGKIPYGRYKLALYDGPIYIEDLRE